MNLLILVFILISQLIFQAVYFESYYLSKKKDLLHKNISEFQNYLGEGKSHVDAVKYMKSIKDKDNIALSYWSSDLSMRVGLESYMGNRQLILKGDDGENYKIVIMNQLVKLKVKKGDYIQAIGKTDAYGFYIPERLFVNGVEVSTDYTYMESAVLNSSALEVMPSQNHPIESSNMISGYVEEIVKEDNTYEILSYADLYLSAEEKVRILNNKIYNERVNSSNSMDDLMYTSQRVNGGYIIAVTALSEVNEVIGTMNSFYLMIFIFAFILILIISYIYSKIMTKPLVEMSKIAQRISQCDFQFKYKVTREDEIGILGSSLNSISDNLEKSLNDLQCSNEKLKEEMKAQRYQEEKRKELIANVSHELKTPITIIQGTINGIKDGIYTTEMYEDIIDETEKLNDLVKEMLEVSKLESPSFKLNKEPFDLYSLILKAQDKLKSMIKDKKLKVIVDCDDEAIVFGDEKRINQVVTNLFINAIKYTHQGESIEITIEYLSETDEYLFKIKNYGVTLTKEEQEKIWDSFYRAEKSRNKRFGGTGLGLSIVKRILELHGSDYGVRSEDNSVEFYFTLSKCMGY